MGVSQRQGSSDLSRTLAFPGITTGLFKSQILCGPAGSTAYKLSESKTERNFISKSMKTTLKGKCRTLQAFITRKEKMEIKEIST
jgi:hypothetical protein